MASSRVPRPAFLNPVSSQTDEDAPLVRSQVAAVWPFVEHFARHEARRVLSRVPLEGARSLASRKGVFAAVIADQGAIRHALRQNEVDDLVQAVAVAFIEAVDRGAVRSSEHAVRGWIRAVTWLVGARASRTPAALLFGAGPADDSDDGPNGHAFTAQAREPSPEDLAALRQDCGMVAQHLARLSAKLRAVVDLWVDGLGYAAIATTLGITQGTARLRLFRALDALRTALMPRAGPRPRRGGRRPFHFHHERFGWLGRTKLPNGSQSLDTSQRFCYLTRHPGELALHEAASCEARPPGAASPDRLATTPPGVGCCMFHRDFPRYDHLRSRRYLPSGVDFAGACLGMEDILRDRLLAGADPRELGTALGSLIAAARRRTPAAALADTYRLYEFLVSVHKATLSGIHNYFLTCDHDTDPDGMIDPTTLPSEADLVAWSHPIRF